MAALQTKSRRHSSVIAPVPALRRFTVDEYYGMAQVGVLRADERLELLEGEIVVAIKESPMHAAARHHQDGELNRNRQRLCRQS